MTRGVSRSRMRARTASFSSCCFGRKSCAVVIPLLAGATIVVLRMGGLAGLSILLPALFFAVGSLGFITPNATALALQHQGKRAGAATALMGALQLGLAALSSSAMSLWQTHSELPFALIIAASGAGAVLIYLLAPKE